jgi:outer membrane receptor protein involved in Fe transport
MSATRAGRWGRGRTIDLQLRYRAPANGWARGLSVALSAQNLFDADPPFVNRFTGFGYDAANADPIGRFVALQIIKSW